MQSSSSRAAQSDFLNVMQPQSAQNMYVPSSGSNNAGNVRTNQQSATFYRAPSASPAPRGGARSVPMQALYQPTVHQNVVLQTFPSYGPRQPPTFQPPYPYTQPMQTNYYPYPYYPTLQQQSHQRGAVNVNAGVGVSTAMSVQTGPLNGPPGSNQTQLPIGAGTVITGAVPPGSGAVLGNPASVSGQQVSVTPMVGVVQTAVSSQPTRQPRRQRNPLQIIHPTTKKNILDEYDVSKSQSSTIIPSIQSDTGTVTPQQDHSAAGTGTNVLVIPSDTRSNVSYNMDIHQMPQQHDLVVGQPSVVSAIPEGSSVEILPITQKPRPKKIIPIVAPKDEQAREHKTTKNTHALDKQTIQTKNIEQTDLAEESDSVQQQQLSLHTSQVRGENSQELIAKVIVEKEEKLSSSIENTSSTKNIKNTADLNEDDNFPSPVECSNDTYPILSNDNNTTTVTFTYTVEEGVPETIIGTNAENVIVVNDSSSLQSMQLNENEVTAVPAVTSSTSSSNVACLNVSNDINCAVETASTEFRNGTPDSNDKISNNDDLADAEPESNNNVEKADETCDETDRAQIKLIDESKINTNNNDQSKIFPEKNVSSVKSSSVSNSGGTKMLISYNEGQWSPNNPTGKKQYDREQLLQLREAKASRVQPEVTNLAILPQPNFMPSFMRPANKHVQSMVGSFGGSRSGDGSGGNFSKQGSTSGVYSRNSMKAEKGMILVNLSLNQDVKLNETDNAWRPRVLLKNSENENDPHVKSKREKDELIRRVRGILNKLTPEKFDTLVEEIIKLKIDTPDKMEDVIVLVFEKAIDEPSFSVSYARLCHRLITEVKNQDERMESGTKSNLSKFRAALIDKTEREFTQNVTQSSAKAKKLQPTIDKIKECNDPVEKAELEAQLEEEERKIRRRSGGTVRFIGELFKISMLTGKIINSCIETLLNPSSEDMLECLCKLLTTVGAKFEQTPIFNKNANRLYSLDRTIARMQAIASKTDKEGAKISSRVRFMLQDVIDLRKNKWQSTRNEAPKTMDQIKKEAKTEQLSSQYLNYSGASSGSGNAGAGGSQGVSGKRDDRGVRFGGDSRSLGGYSGSHSQRGENGSLRRQQQSGSGTNSISGSHSNGSYDDNTWTVQTNKGSRLQAVDTIKLEGLLNQSLETGVKKMGGVSQFLWSTRQQLPATTTPSNSFAALSSLVDLNRSSDRDRDHDRSGPRTKNSYNKSSMERDRGIHSRTGSSQASRENSSSRNGSQGHRGISNTSSMQKSASHSKYSQPASTRITDKLSKIPLFPQRDEQLNISISGTHNQSDGKQSPHPSAPPFPVFKEPTSSDIKIINSVLSEMIEVAMTIKGVNSSVILCINRIKDDQRCGFLYYIMTEYLDLCDVGQVHRRYLGNIVAYLIENNFISVEHFKLSYAHFCKAAGDLVVDVPDLWLYIFQFTGPLITKNIVVITDLWNENLKKEYTSPNLGRKFLKGYLTYCTCEVGPSFTRNMWKKFNMKWDEFIPESEVKEFIQTNKFEYIENDSIQPGIVIKGPYEKHITRIVEHVEHLLTEKSSADSIIDYINGNIADIDKLFIRRLTTTLCNFAIIYKENSYKLETLCFREICVPLLQRYIDSKEERELECLYSMQILVNDLEHPRGLLSELFAELYDGDVIPQDSFIKWRDSKDQSAGKGVAVKGLNQFFNHILSGETSEENN